VWNALKEQEKWNYRTLNNREIKVSLANFPTRITARGVEKGATQEKSNVQKPSIISNHSHNSIPFFSLK
jgi:hypothetical protein